MIKRDELQSLVWELVQKLYNQELAFSNYRKQFVPDDDEFFTGKLTPICSPRVSGATNKYYWRELLFDGTPEERSEFVSESIMHLQEHKKGLESPLIPEMEKLLEALASDASCKIKGKEYLSKTIDNFARARNIIHKIRLVTNATTYPNLM